MPVPTPSPFSARSTRPAGPGSAASQPRRVGRLRRRILLHRRGLAALCAAVAVYLLIQSAQPPPPDTVAVWTASSDLPSGTRLGPEDLARRDYLHDSVPAGATRRANSLTGRILAAPVGSGEPITQVRLIGHDLAASYPGRTLVPLRLADDAVAGLLRVGDRITLLAADPDSAAEAEMVSDEVVVAGLPTPEKSMKFESQGRLILAAIPTETATKVATLSATRLFIALWNR